jgi:hypothetical protein
MPTSSRVKSIISLRNPFTQASICWKSIGCVSDMAEFPGFLSFLVMHPAGILCGERMAREPG